MKLQVNLNYWTNSSSSFKDGYRSDTLRQSVPIRFERWSLQPKRTTRAGDNTRYWYRWSIIDRWINQWSAITNLWSQRVRARQDLSNGGLWGANGPPEPEIAPVIGSSDRLLIDKSISDQQRPKLWLQMARARQYASNGGLCSPNGPPGPELAPVIGKMYRFLIDILISEA